MKQFLILLLEIKIIKLLFQKKKNENQINLLYILYLYEKLDK